jgi:hypothetical protein
MHDDGDRSATWGNAEFEPYPTLLPKASRRFGVTVDGGA